MRACMRKVPQGSWSTLTAEGEDAGARRRGGEKRATIRTAGDHETVPLDAYACTAARMPQQRYQREVRRATVASWRLAAPRDAARPRGAARRGAARRRLGAPSTRGGSVRAHATRTHSPKRRDRIPPCINPRGCPPLSFFSPSPSSSHGVLNYAHLS